MTKVLVLCKDFNAPGGVANFVQSIVSNLPESVSVQRLSIGRPTGREGIIQSLISPFRDHYRLAKHITKNRPDCIHLNPSLNWTSLLRDGSFLVTLRLFRFESVLVYFHGWRDNEAAAIKKSKWKSRLFKFVFGHAKVICVLASRFKSDLEEIGIAAEQVTVCTTMFDAEMFKGLSRQPSTDRRRVLFLGRIVKQKGVYEVLNAFHRTIADNPDVTLQIAGTGEELEHLKAETAKLGIEGQVEFLGYVTGRDKAQLLLDADVFAFPTYYPEGCPVSLLEAMAAGLPILTGPAGGIPDIIKDGENGILLNAVSQSAVDSGLEKLIKSDQHYAKIGAHNREYAWQRFSSDVVVDDVVSLYRVATGA